MALITTKTLKQFIQASVDLVESLTQTTLNTAVGAVVKAILTAVAVNHVFIQAQIKRVALNSRFDTADDDATDTFVNQFVPPFTPRIEATAPSSTPASPTTLASAAPSGGGYLRVNSITGLVLDQALLLTKGTKTATTTITGLEPLRALTADVKDDPGATTSQGATLMEMDDTEGIFPGASLLLTDGGYSVTVVVTAVNSATEVAITPLTSAIPHLYGSGTDVKLVNVLEVDPLVFGGATVVGDLTVGTQVRATTLLEGQRFYRNTADTSQPEVPVGHKIISQDGTAEYEVVADTSNADYNTAKSAYVMPSGATEVFVKVQATTTGTGQRVLADKLTVLPVPISGIDGTTNPYPIQNGSDRETSSALRTRFRAFIAGLNGPNEKGIEAAIAGVETGVQYSLLQNVAEDGVTPQGGNFVVIVSDANGALGTDLYNKVYAAVDAAKAFTTTFDIVPPQVIVPTIDMVLSIDPDAVAADVRSTVKAALFTSQAGKPANSEMVFWDLVRLAMAQSGVLDVLKLTITVGADPEFGFDSTGGSYTTVGTGPENVTGGPFELIRPSMASISVA